MNWLKTAGLFLRQALKSVNWTVAIMYVLDIAETIATVLTKNTFIDDYFIAVIKGIIEIYKNRGDKSLYDIAEEIGTIIKELAEFYEDLENKK